MSNLIIEKLLAKSRRTDLPKFGPGDTVKVQVKIKEGDKERIQAFEGVVIARTRGPQASFTVRKISFGQGVERIFPLQSKVDRQDRCAALVESAAREALLPARAEGQGGSVAGSRISTLFVVRLLAARGLCRVSNSRTRERVYPLKSVHHGLQPLAASAKMLASSVSPRSQE